MQNNMQNESVKNWITSTIGRKQVCVKTEHILITAIYLFIM